MRIEQIHAALIESGKKLALAESCTGGAIAAALTAIPDASKFLLGSLVAYSNDWKEQFLGVKSIQTKGAVSQEVVEEMVQGLFARTECDIAAAVSGIAGPTGGSAEKPVGTIFIAVGVRGGPVKVKRMQGPQDRKRAIAFAVETTLTEIYDVSVVR